MNKTNNKPLFYVRGDEVRYNYYLHDAHPNDKKSHAKAGVSRGRMIGLEEAGWTPMYDQDDDHNPATVDKQVLLDTLEMRRRLIESIIKA